MDDICLTHLIILHLITPTTFGEHYKWRHYSTCSFLPPPATPSPLCADTKISSASSNQTPSNYHSEVAYTVQHIAVLTEAIKQLCALYQYFTFTHFNLWHVSALLLHHHQGGLIFLVNIQHTYKLCGTRYMVWWTSYEMKSYGVLHPMMQSVPGLFPWGKVATAWHLPPTPI
jgi:hypothetical protein